MPHFELTQFVDAQKTDISVSVEGDFGEMKKTETPSKRQIFGRYVVFNSTAEETASAYVSVTNGVKQGGILSTWPCDV